MDTGEGLLVNGEVGELSAMNGEWNERASVLGIETTVGFVRCERVRACFARERMVLGMAGYKDFVLASVDDGIKERNNEIGI